MTNNARMHVASTVRSICNSVRSTLGPYGANKLVVENNGTVTVTSSGAIVLDRLDIEDPSLTLLESAASGFADSYGDGTTRLLVLVNALLQEAIELADEQGLSTAAIARGYREALAAATDHIDIVEKPLSDVGASTVARTALTGVNDDARRRDLGEFVDSIVEYTDGEFDRSNVAVTARLGGSQSETELLAGVVLDRDPVAEQMPRSLPDAGVAVISDTVDVPKLGDLDGRENARVVLDTDTFDERTAIVERENELFREHLSAAVDAGCRFVATSEAVNDRVKTLLANHGVLAVHRVEESELDRLARATDAEVVPGLAKVTKETLGKGTVTVTRLAGRDITVVESSDAAPVHTVLCRAPDPRSVEAFERSVEAAIASASHARDNGTVVPGGGAVEMGAARAVTRSAQGVDTSEQLAIEAFGRALTAVPQTLAVNAKMDRLDALVALREAHATGHHATGIDCFAGKTADVVADAEEPVVDPARLTRAVWSAATDLAVGSIRIDEQLSATDLPDGATHPDVTADAT